MYLTQGDVKRTELALTMLFTLRGIPEMLYGTEIGMMGRGDGMVPSNFPGGFPGDSLNAFTAKGRSPKEKELFTEVKKLIRLHRERKSLSYGEMIHFPPVNEVYTYIRIYQNEKTLVIVNNRDDAQKVSLSQVRGYFTGAAMKDLMTGKTVDLKDATDVDVPANEALVLGID